MCKKKITHFSFKSFLFLTFLFFFLRKSKNEITFCTKKFTKFEKNSDFKRIFLIHVEWKTHIHTRCIQKKEIHKLCTAVQLLFKRVVVRNDWGRRGE